ncbi:hypothetical protein ABEV77_03935 [Bacillus subtilis]
MTETNANASIHVLADETLGGIKREYVEVDRKAEVGEKIVIVAKDDREEGYKNGDVFTVDREYRPDDGVVESDEASSEMNCSGLIYREEYRVLEPTDIVHIDTQRYELTDRKAEVGEMVIYNGNIATVKSVSGGFVKVEDYEDAKGDVIGGFSHGLYRVLVPVEAESDEPQPADLIDVVANLAKEVAELKRENNERDDAIKKILSGMYDKTKRLENEIDTLHKDSRTLGEDLARLQEPKETEELAPIDAPLVFVQRKIGDAFDVYQDGKKLRGVRHIRIDAAVGEFTTHDIECFTGAESEEERP